MIINPLVTPNFMAPKAQGPISRMSGNSPSAGGAANIAGADLVVTLSNNELFYDDFAYNVSRTDSNKSSPATNPFETTGNWVAFKDEVTAVGAAAYLYTETDKSIVGNIVPNRAGTHFFIFESIGATKDPDQQTDAFLELGDNNIGDIPADVWFEYWVYAIDTGSYPGFDGNRFKFIYPNKEINYPASATGGVEWLVSMGNENSANGICGVTDIGATGGYYLFSVDSGSDATFDALDGSVNCASANHHMGHTEDDGGGEPIKYIQPNQWTQVRIHIDTSGTTGIFQAWMRGLDEAYVLTHDWRDAVSPHASFGWNPIDANGHRRFRLFTTVPGNVQPSAYQDCFIMLGDFCMAAGTNSGGNGISDLPTYSR